MNRSLASRVVEFFRDDVCRDSDYFSGYDERDWRKTKTWLDSSGLALYFLARLKELDLTACVPATILAELEQNLTDRELEVKQRVERFTDLLQIFQQHKIPFVVEKGIALVPEYCPEIRFRFQVDFDFLVRTDDVERCHDLLVSRGYRYFPTIDGERRFNKGDVGIPSMSAFYKPKQKHCVELHFGNSEETSAKLSGAILHQVGAVMFPVLSRVDCFVDYVLHFAKHLRGGWVRADGLLEFRRFVSAVEGDPSFWAEVHRRCGASGALVEALAIMSMLGEKVLGMRTIPELMQIVNATSGSIRRWVDRYAWRVLLTEYPGTKLPIILELASGRRRWPACIRMIFPTAYRLNRVAESDGRAGSDRQAFIAQARYFLVRSRYHLKESVRMSYELLAWSCVRQKRELPSDASST